jgi:GH15 family glucan-1,4-alpha-glucosidase
MQITDERFDYTTSDGVASVDGLPDGEGAFVARSFWLVANYALAGRLDDARVLFERLLSLRNDVGLLAEECGPRSGRRLGNFPQAFSHVPPIMAAHVFDGAVRRRSTDALKRRSA